ncbi:uncharacterized protein LOC135937936 [Cloeon dipterum]|uniref:uncharacterized protein LOC135937936 n=1 Tax=Cloeon dipterum TaxID=197152 RepID=UPI0032204B04
MPQGKMKVKAKVPEKYNKKKSQIKGPAVTKRANRPEKPKVSSLQKLKNETIKNINKSTEDELRQKALDGKVNLGKGKKRPAPGTEKKESQSEEAPTKR